MTVHVVGMGLAGSWITWELLQRGISVITSDNLEPHTSSRIAAGLINPITGLPPKENWNGVAILHHARAAYLNVERATNEKVWHDQTIRRVFSKEQDARDWIIASERGLLTTWRHIEPGLFDGIEFPFGGVEYPGATIDTKTFLTTILSYSAPHSLILPHTTPHLATLTIWCEGWLATQNDLWSWLPFQPVKGEILDAEIGPPFLNAIHIGGCWIVPQRLVNNDAQQRIRIGSTYDWDDLTHASTEKAKSLLLQRATDIIARPINVVEHNAAIRPAAQSKRPYLGRHPMHPEHAILNGFGAKGALWAPWAAQHLVAHLFDGQELNAEVDIQRWWKG